MPFDPTAWVGTISLLNKFVGSDEMLDGLASIDLNVAAQSLRNANKSDNPREHYLSARNHLESSIGKRKASLKGIFGGVSKAAYVLILEDLIYALALKSILDFALGDIEICKQGIAEIEVASLKYDKLAKDLTTLRAGGRADLPAALWNLPKAIYRRHFSKPGRIESPSEFCNNMWSLVVRPCV